MLKDGTIAVLGLGNMGFEMARNMLEEGFSVIGTTRNLKKREEFAALGGKIVENAAEAGKIAKYIALVLPSAAALHSVSEELCASCEPGTIVIEMGTIPLAEKEAARERLEKKQIQMLDVPLSGTVPHIKTREIAAYGSGDEAAWNQIIPLLETFSRKTMYLGEFGNGMKMKMISNQILAVQNLVAAEAVLFCEKLGMDPKLMVQAVFPSAFTPICTRAPLMADRAWNKTMIATKVFWKDITIIQEELLKRGCPSPLFNTTIPFYNAAITSGHADDDSASIFAILKRMADNSEI